VLWKWMRKNMIDREYGEWFRTIRANGTIEKTFDKIDLWKCPYHNVRMGIQAYERIHKRSTNEMFTKAITEVPQKVRERSKLTIRSQIVMLHNHG
jgi:hypothetical protein